LSALVPADAAGNRATGQALFFDSRDTYVHSEDRLVAALGVEGLVIVDTPDALLVAHRDKAQDVKKVVAQLKERDHETYKLHRTVVRPWGSYTVLEEGVSTDGKCPQNTGLRCPPDKAGASLCCVKKQGKRHAQPRGLAHDTRNARKGVLSP
jgi:hypothetical protein